MKTIPIKKFGTGAEQALTVRANTTAQMMPFRSKISKTYYRVCWKTRTESITRWDRYPEFDQRLVGWITDISTKGRAGIHAPDQFVSLAHVLHESRLYKSRQEVKAMKKAADIAAAGHCRAMQVCKPGMYEYQIEAELLHTFMSRGSRWPAYPSIVGGGANGCILHYIDNCDPLKDGDLLLIDAGAEYDCYASDITRTFPVNGEFSREQRDIYEIVLQAQKDAIAEVHPGNTWNEPP